MAGKVPNIQYIRSEKEGVPGIRAFIFFIQYLYIIPPRY